MQSEKLYIEIEAKNNVSPGLKDVQDDITGFNARIKSQSAVSLSLNLAELQVRLTEAKELLKVAKADNDRASQVTITADIEILKRQVTQAGRELNNLARTGQKDVSVLGNLFQGVYSRVEAVAAKIPGATSVLSAFWSVGRSAMNGLTTATTAMSNGMNNVQAVSAKALAGMTIGFQFLMKAVAIAKQSYALFQEQAGKESGSKEKIRQIQDAFARLEYMIWSVVAQTVDAFFSMFWKNTQEWIDNVAKFWSYSVAVVQGLMASFSALLERIIYVVQAIPDLFTAAFSDIPNIASNALNWALDALYNYGELWKGGMNEIFGTNFSSWELKQTASKPLTNLAPIIADISSTFDDIGKNSDALWSKYLSDAKSRTTQAENAKGKISLDMQSKRIATGTKMESAAEAAKKKALEDAKRAEEERIKSEEDQIVRLTKFHEENEKKRLDAIQKQKDSYRDAYGSIVEAISKANDKATELSDKMKDVAKSMDEVNSTAQTDLGARFVEVTKAMADENTTAEERVKLEKELDLLSKSTTQAIRDQALAYDAMSPTERIIMERDAKIAALAAEGEALKAQLDAELAARTALTDARIALEQRFTTAYAQSIETQKSLADQLTERLNAVASAARAASMASASAGVSTVNNTNVNVSATVTDAAAAASLLNNINSKITK